MLRRRVGCRHGGWCTCVLGHQLVVKELTLPWLMFKEEEEEEESTALSLSDESNLGKSGKTARAQSRTKPLMLSTLLIAAITAGALASKPPPPPPGPPGPQPSVPPITPPACAAGDTPVKVFVMMVRKDDALCLTPAHAPPPTMNTATGWTRRFSTAAAATAAVGGSGCARISTDLPTVFFLPHALVPLPTPRCCDRVEPAHRRLPASQLNCAQMQRARVLSVGPSLSEHWVRHCK